MESQNFNTQPPKSKMKEWQVRWNEPIGPSECPYLYRWVLLTPYFSIRLHHFIRSDDKRYFHDHAWDFYTFILKGCYWDVSKDMRTERKHLHLYKVKAEHAHYVDIPYGGCWTIVLSKKPKRKWGFWVDDKFKRPLKYFHKFGHPPCDEQ